MPLGYYIHLLTINYLLLISVGFLPSYSYISYIQILTWSCSPPDVLFHSLTVSQVPIHYFLSSGSRFSNFSRTNIRVVFCDNSLSLLKKMAIQPLRLPSGLASWTGYLDVCTMYSPMCY